MNGASLIGGRLRSLRVLACLLGMACWTLSPAALAQTAEPPAEAAPGESTEHGAPAAEAPLEHDVAEAEHGAGMPQLDVATYVSQIVWLVLTFGILFWLLSRKALPRVAEILEARQDRIAADLDRAAELRTEAEAAERKHEQVVAEAHARAQAQIKEVSERLAADAVRRQAALDSELAKKLHDAEARIGEARKAALAQLHDVAVESARAAASRVAGIEVDRATAEAAFRRATAGAA